MIRDHGPEFHRRLALTPPSKVEFQAAVVPVEDEVERARRGFVRWRQSPGGRGDSFGFTLRRVRRQTADAASGHLSPADHRDLAAVRNHCRSRAALSGYLLDLRPGEMPENKVCGELEPQGFEP